MYSLHIPCHRDSFYLSFPLPNAFYMWFFNFIFYSPDNCNCSGYWTKSKYLWQMWAKGNSYKDWCGLLYVKSQIAGESNIRCLYRIRTNATLDYINSSSMCQTSTIILLLCSAMIKLQQQDWLDRVGAWHFKKTNWKPSRWEQRRQQKWLRKYDSEGFKLCILFTCIKKMDLEQYPWKKDGVKTNGSFLQNENHCVYHIQFK